MRNYDLARIAYDAYKEETGGVSLISGERLPDFDSLKMSIQDAWWQAAEAVKNAIVEKTE